MSTARHCVRSTTSPAPSRRWATSAPRAALLDETIATLIRLFGEDDGDTLTAMGNFAALLWQSGERDEAYALQEQVAAGLRRTLARGRSGAAAGRGGARPHAARRLRHQLLNRHDRVIHAARVRNAAARRAE